MGKGQRLDVVLAAVDIARRHGLGTHLEWIIGAPEEDVGSLAASLVGIHNLLVAGVVDSVNSYVYCPHPGTDYATNPESYGMQIIDGPEAMQESGGYPAAVPALLTRQQVFVAYLMSQLVITETVRARERAGPQTAVPSPNFGALRDILAQVGVVDEVLIGEQGR